MEKQDVRINYSGSGVQTLDGFGTFFFIVAAISIIVAVISLMTIIGIVSAGTFFSIAISSLASGAICKGLSTIAKTALYKRMLLEKRYNFVEAETSIEESRKIEETENEISHKYKDADKFYISRINTKKGIIEIHSKDSTGYSIGDLVYLGNTIAPNGKYSKGWVSWLDFIIVKDGRIYSINT